MRNYSLHQRFKLWKAISSIDHISAAYPPLLDKNSAVFSTAIPQLFSAFSACFAHEMGASITVTFHLLLRSFSEGLQRTLPMKKGETQAVKGKLRKKQLRGRAVAGLRGFQQQARMSGRSRSSGDRPDSNGDDLMSLPGDEQRGRHIAEQPFPVQLKLTARQRPRVHGTDWKRAEELRHMDGKSRSEKHPDENGCEHTSLLGCVQLRPVQGGGW